MVYSPSSGLGVDPGGLHQVCKLEPGLDTLPVHSGWDLPSPDPSSWRGEGKLFGFMVSIVFLMDRCPNCNLQIFLLDPIDRVVYEPVPRDCRWPRKMNDDDD